ncbi:MAG TPA: lysophospholipid acyltransferase family protein [Kiritimatiellia bacterium]|nr:lysophospholipid acyltransferase family protein [Kiritimatiellia bacterium]
MTVEDRVTTRVYRFCRWLVKGYARLFHRIRWSGVEQLPAEGACILAANHASYLDPPIMGCVIPHRFLHSLAKESLFKNPLMRWLLRRLFVIPLQVDKGDVGALKLSLKLLKDGKCIALYPEGSRSFDGEFQPAKGGVGFLMLKAKVPVIPVYLDGTHEALARGKRWIRPHRIGVHFGAPITPDAFDVFSDDEDKYVKVAQMVMDRIAEIKTRVRAR